MSAAAMSYPNFGRPLAAMSHFEDAFTDDDFPNDVAAPFGRLTTEENWPVYDSSPQHQESVGMMWLKQDSDDSSQQGQGWGQQAEGGPMLGTQGVFPMAYAPNSYCQEQPQPQGLCSPVAGVQDLLADWSTASSAGTNTPPSEWSNSTYSAFQAPRESSRVQDHHSAAQPPAAGSETPPFEWSSASLSSPRTPEWTQQTSFRQPLPAGRTMESKAPLLPAALQFSHDDPPLEWGETTTLMMRNLPNKYSQHMLLADIKAARFEGAFDFFYLPIDHATGANKGYAFVNFRRPDHAWRFKQHYEGRRMSRFNSEKTVSVSPATLQGFDANYAHYANSRVNRGDPSCRPLFLREPTCPAPPPAMDRDAVRGAGGAQYGSPGGQAGRSGHGGFGGRGGRGRVHQRGQTRAAW